LGITMNVQQLNINVENVPNKKINIPKLIYT